MTAVTMLATLMLIAAWEALHGRITVYAHTACEMGVEQRTLRVHVAPSTCRLLRVCATVAVVGAIAVPVIQITAAVAAR